MKLCKHKWRLIAADPAKGVVEMACQRLGCESTKTMRARRVSRCKTC
jgi:hypothetical protein